MRCWTADGLQLHEIRPGDTSVTALAIDMYGFVLVATMDKAVRVYDVETQEVVQQHYGHADAVRSILHVPQKGQYLTASWDRTIRVWTHYTPPQSWHKHRAEVERARMLEESLEEGEEGAEGSVHAAAVAAAAAPGAEPDGGAHSGEDEEGEEEGEEEGVSGEGAGAAAEEEEFIPYSVRFRSSSPSASLTVARAVATSSCVRRRRRARALAKRASRRSRANRRPAWRASSTCWKSDSSRSTSTLIRSKRSKTPSAATGTEAKSPGRCAASDAPDATRCTRARLPVCVASHLGRLVWPERRTQLSVCHVAACTAFGICIRGAGGCVSSSCAAVRASRGVWLSVGPRCPRLRRDPPGRVLARGRLSSVI